MINSENEEAARKLRKLGERLRIALDPHYGKNVVVKLKGSKTLSQPSEIKNYSGTSQDRSRATGRTGAKQEVKRAKSGSVSVKKPTKK